MKPHRFSAKCSVICLLIALVLVQFSISNPAHAATLGSGECAQTVSGLTGAVVKEGSSYCLIAFKGPSVASGSSGSWTVPAGVTKIDYLIVGGGGAGGGFGGGGGGGFLESKNVSVTAGSSIAVSIGSGGVAAKNLGGNGNPSSLTIGATTVSAGGGGGGGGMTTLRVAVPTTWTVNWGGSGGGAGVASTTSDACSVPVQVVGGPAGTGSGNLNKGGDYQPLAQVSMTRSSATVTCTIYAGGGGGGAGEAGRSGTYIASTGTPALPQVTGGFGGAGSASTLFSTSSAASLGIGQVSGSSTYFAGGGGGGGFNNGADPNTFYYQRGNGGLGGGGRSADGNVGVLPGTANTGGGGGGFFNADNDNGGAYFGGAGGSGLVLIRYVIPGQSDPEASPTPTQNSGSNSTNLSVTTPAPSLAETGTTSSTFFIAVLSFSALLVGALLIFMKSSSKAR